MISSSGLAANPAHAPGIRSRRFGALTADPQPGANQHLRRVHTVGVRFREGDDDDSATTARRGRDRAGGGPDRHRGGLLTVERGRTGQPGGPNDPFVTCMTENGVPAPPQGAPPQGGPGGPGGQPAARRRRVVREDRAAASCQHRRGSINPCGTRVFRRARRWCPHRHRSTDGVAQEALEMGRPPSRISWLDKPGARGPGSCLEFASARRAQVIPGTWCC